MKQIEVEFTLSIGDVCSEYKDTFRYEFEDDVTQKKIEEKLEEDWVVWKDNYIDGGWKILKGEDNP